MFYKHVLRRVTVFNINTLPERVAYKDHGIKHHTKINLQIELDSIKLLF